MATKHYAGVKFLRAGARMPYRATSGSGGYDVFLPEDVQLKPCARRAIPLGFALELPPRFSAIVLPRSGYALRGMAGFDYDGKESLFNADVEVTLIDSDYRGEVAVILHNRDGRPMRMKAGQRIAQFKIVEDPIVEFIERSVLSESERGDGGFGSTNDKNDNEKGQ